MDIPMNGPAWVALLTLLAVLAVLALVVADHHRMRSEPVDESEPVVIDQDGCLVATQEMPLVGRHRAPRGWSR